MEFRSNAIEEMRQGMIEWAEKHSDKVLPLSMAKADFTKSKGFDGMIEHVLTEHDGNIEGLREMMANAKITIPDD